MSASRLNVLQVAVRWLLQRPAVASVLIGPRTIEQMDDGCAIQSPARVM